MDLPQFSAVYAYREVMNYVAERVPPSTAREMAEVNKYRQIGIDALNSFGTHWVDDSQLIEAVAARAKPALSVDYPDGGNEPLPLARARYTTWLLQHAHLAARRERDRRQGIARGAITDPLQPVVDPAPAPQPFGVSDRGAEELVAQWMRYLGAPAAMTTQFSGDGGIDVVSDLFIAQVKNYRASISIASMRELAGVAAVDRRKPLFFTSGVYPPSAIGFADQSGIALFCYDAIAGTIAGKNDLGRRGVQHGLPSLLKD
ncbi:restriction endonuclease [Agromyces sp. NPDC056379]|uniref:restriction endonuclease n=1 Tax=unclassified Agromyces TaxID=2639701 RepID=UPI0035D6578C